MKVCRGVAQLQRARAQRAAPWALVPTMGNLHAGHLRLVAAAHAEGRPVVVSIYVNPLQFGAGEDFAQYPRTLDADLAALQAVHADVVFVPAESDLYPRGVSRQTRVRVPGLSDILCGATRPGHFEGVATVVHRLLTLTAPECAVFGKKDYQQWHVIRRMQEDLSLPVRILGVDTVRDADGLALSSRNGYLSAEERVRAPALYAGLRQVVADGADAAGEWRGTLERVRTGLQQGGWIPEYLEVRRQADLELPHPADRDLVVLAAARLGRTRLIDNLEFRRTV
ncbi:MAG TPA: pantoate--beta-alanine ligase [Acidiferrobacteraceae bacterium]|nr:pantoate--beta-alanine ligase [Acidiferrobacteraceae bacterium]